MSELNGQRVMSIIGSVLVTAGILVAIVAMKRGRGSGLDYDNITLASLDAEIERLDKAIRLAQIGGRLCMLGSIVSFIALGMGL
jgi:hypothetical protein